MFALFNSCFLICSLLWVFCSAEYKVTIIHLDHNRSQSSISPLTKTRGTGSHLFFWKIWGQCLNFFLHSCFHCSNSSLEVGYTYSPSSSSSSSSAPRDETTLASAHCYEDINHGLWGSWFGVLALEQPHPGPLGWPRREGGEGRRWQELSSFR